MKIAHISDLHFVYGPGIMRTMSLTSAPAILSLFSKSNTVKVSLTAYAAWRARVLSYQVFRLMRSVGASRGALLNHLHRQKPDHIIITGDFTTVGHPKEYSRALSYLRKLQGIVGEHGITIIPGNHDINTDLKSRLFCRNTQYRLANYLHYFKDFCQNENNAFFPFKKRIGELFLLGFDTTGVDFCLPGQVSKEQLSRASDYLETPEAKDSCKVILLHHHLHLPDYLDISRYIPYGRVFRKCFDLSNGTDIINLCKEYKIESVMHGHVHKPYSVNHHLKNECAGATLVPIKANGRRYISYALYNWQNGALKRESFDVGF